MGISDKMFEGRKGKEGEFIKVMIKIKKNVIFVLKFILYIGCNLDFWILGNIRERSKCYDSIKILRRRVEEIYIL